MRQTTEFSNFISRSQPPRTAGPSGPERSPEGPENHPRSVRRISPASPRRVGRYRSRRSTKTDEYHPDAIHGGERARFTRGRGTTGHTCTFPARRRARRSIPDGGGGGGGPRSSKDVAQRSKPYRTQTHRGVPCERTEISMTVATRPASVRRNVPNAHARRTERRITVAHTTEFTFSRAKNKGRARCGSRSCRRGAGLRTAIGRRPPRSSF